MTKQVTINNTKAFKHEFKFKDVYALRNTEEKVNDVYLALCNEYKCVEYQTLNFYGNNIAYAEIACVSKIK